MTLFLDGSPLADLSPPFTYLWAPQLPDGVHTLTAIGTWTLNGAISAPVSVTVDRIPPTVRSISLPGYSDICTPITVTFSKRVTAASFAGSFATSTAQGYVSTNFSLDASGMVARVYPQAMTPVDLQISLNGIQDLAGNSVSASFPAHLSFMQSLMDVPDSYGHSQGMGMVLDSGGNPIVEMTIPGNYEADAHLLRWNGRKWGEFAIIPHVNQSALFDAGDVRMAVLPSGHLLVGLIEATNGNYSGHILEWGGSSWSEWPQPDRTITSSWISEGADGSISVIHGDPFSNPSLARWTGSSWQDLPGAFDAGWIPETDPAGSASGAVAVAEYNYYKFDVHQWNGSTWSDLGLIAPSPPTAYVDAAQLTYDLSGAPVVTFLQGDGSSYLTDVVVKRWDGAAWQQLGADQHYQPGEEVFGARTHSLPDGRLLLVWNEDVLTNIPQAGLWLFASIWDGQQWQPLGCPNVHGTSDLISWYPNIATSGTVTGLAFGDDTGAYQGDIFVRR